METEELRTPSGSDEISDDEQCPIPESDDDDEEEELNEEEEYQSEQRRLEMEEKRRMAKQAREYREQIEQELTSTDDTQARSLKIVVYMLLFVIVFAVTLDKWI